jgi:predicted dehydrogenase
MAETPFFFSSTRRQWMKRTAFATLPAWFLQRNPTRVYAEEKSPNERPRLALIGCGGMGTADGKLAQKFGDIVAVCDVDAGRLDVGTRQFKGSRGYSDFRQIADLNNIDAVINATPDHWHTLVNARLIKSGKDVYGEKPLTLTIDEGKRLIKIVRASKQILQVGSQQRSDQTFRLACELVRNGRLGKIQRVRTWLPTGLREGPFQTAPVPKELNWDFWQGQTSAVEYVPQRCHQRFRYWWDYSGGTLTDWGAHHNDIALWGLGKDLTGPVNIEGKATVEPVPGGYTAASQFQVRYVYDDGIEHLCRNTTANGRSGNVVGKPGPGEKYHGVQFEGTEGWIYVSRGNVLEASDPALLSTPLPESAIRMPVSDDHMGHFIESIRNRTEPITHVEIGHRSASLCHLGVMAIRLGRPLTWDPKAESFPSDAEANKLLSREMRPPYSWDLVS